MTDHKLIRILIYWCSVLTLIIGIMGYKTLNHLQWSEQIANEILHEVHEIREAMK